MQAELFDAGETFATPDFLCAKWTRCTGKRATAGPWAGDEECRNRTIHCECGRTGTESENLTIQNGKRVRPARLTDAAQGAR